MNLTDYPEYPNYRAMLKRCTDPKACNYQRYGGRGITVHPAWMGSFHAFLADMGPRPSLIHTLDRFPNNDGNYEPGNVRWATPIEQMAHIKTRLLPRKQYKKWARPRKRGGWKMTPCALAVVRDPSLVLDRFENGYTVGAVARNLGISLYQVREVIEQAIGRRAA